MAHVWTRETSAKASEASEPTMVNVPAALASASSAPRSLALEGPLTEEPDGWRMMPLAGDVSLLSGDQLSGGKVSGGKVSGGQAGDASHAPSPLPPRILRVMGVPGEPRGEAWILIGSPAVRVNGEPLDAGIRRLRDRDDLCVDGSRLFFSGEVLAQVVAFPGSERPTKCARCQLEIAKGSPAVSCPQCRVWHHQSDEMPCWVYAEQCSRCDQPTSLDAGFRWTPEAL